MAVQTEFRALTPYQSHTNQPFFSNGFASPRQLGPLDQIPTTDKNGKPISSATYYIDRAREIVQESGGIRAIIEEPSVTWMGRLFDRVYNKFTSKNNAVIDKTHTVAAKTMNQQPQKRAELTPKHKVLWEDSQYWGGLEYFPNCTERDTTYKQGWQAFYAFPDAEAIQNQTSNKYGYDFGLFEEALQRCLSTRVIDLYFKTVSEASAAQNCALQPHDQYFQQAQLPGGYFSLDVWDGTQTTPSNLFANQTTVGLSQEMATACYNSNVEQIPNPVQTNVTYDSESANGSSDVGFLGYFCNRELMRQAWKLVPVSRKIPGYLLSDQRCFNKKYLPCVVNTLIIPYFQMLSENTQGCGQMNFSSTEIKLQSTHGSVITLYSPNGIPNYQANIDHLFNDNNCYSQAGSDCSQRAVTIGVSVGLLSLAGIFFLIVIAVKSCQHLEQKRREREAIPSESELNAPMLGGELPNALQSSISEIAEEEEEEEDPKESAKTSENSSKALKSEQELISLV